MLVTVVIERAIRLDTIQATLDSILSKYMIGVQYLENLESVVSELERVARQADENIMALGARSTAPRYLEAIQDAVQRRKVIYYRLIDGTHIAHQLHEHLRIMLQSENVRIAWTPKEKFGNLTVTEDECIIAFPAPYRHKLSGLRLPGETNSRRWTQYFLEVFSQSQTISEEQSIEILCEKCSPTVERNPEEILRLLKQNQSKAMKGDSLGLL
jgi:hypothetical protein